DEVFVFSSQGYHQSWAVLKDIDTLARAVGLKGLVIEFDEFEDVLTNLKNIDHKQSAFWNLFQFYEGKRFPGVSFFAVTPEFVHKCKVELQSKGLWDYDYSQFEKLPTFEMSPLRTTELMELTGRIITTHGIAYDWESENLVKPQDFK